MPSTELIPAATADLSRMAPGAGLVDAFLAGRTRRTMEAYRADLEDFRAFLGLASMADASAALLSRGHGEANALAQAYKAHLMERGLSAATVNRRLAALRSLCRMAGMFALIPWRLEVENLAAEPYRDTKGPGRDGYRRLMAPLDGLTTAKACRDRALLRLLYDLALRRGEVLALDLADLDLEAGTLAVLGKGRTGKVKLTLPEPTKAALGEWLRARGAGAGPLFTNFDRAAKGERLRASSLYRLVRSYGAAVGLQVRPHGLRHAAITEALDATHGDTRAVQRFSRHKDLRILSVYDDNRADMAGDVARLVAASA
ncbi:MAG: tyrosine-type recombinase/integrase [Candidatus Dormibacteria bacterium]